MTVVNVVIGLLAVVPLTLFVSLVSYAAHGPYPPGTNHTGAPGPIEIDGDEAAVAVMLVLVAGTFLGGVFLTANWLVLRRRRTPVPVGAAWVAASLIALLPFAAVMAFRGP